MSNKCIGCGDDMGRSYHKLCSSCFNNSDVIIYHSDAKRKYGLTDSELLNSSIYQEEFTVHHNTCRKYLLKEVHELARKHCTDHRANKFKKLDVKFQEQLKEEQAYNEKVNRVIQGIYDLLIKYNVSTTNFDIRSYGELMTEIRDMCSDSNGSELDMSGCMVQKCLKIVQYEQRVEETDKALQEALEEFNLDNADSVLTKLVKSYVEQKNQNVGSDQIKKTIRNHCQKRRTEIDTALKDFDLIELAPGEKARLRKNLLKEINVSPNPKLVCDKHVKAINDKKERAERTKKINKILRASLKKYKLEENGYLEQLKLDYVDGKKDDTVLDAIPEYLSQRRQKIDQMVLSFEGWGIEDEYREQLKIELMTLLQNREKIIENEIKGIIYNKQNKLQEVKELIIRRNNVIELFNVSKTIPQKYKESTQKKFIQEVMNTKNPEKILEIYENKYGQGRLMKEELLEENMKNLSPDQIANIKADHTYNNFIENGSVSNVNRFYDGLIKRLNY